MFELPEDLTTLTDDELNALEDEATAEFDGLKDNPSAEDLARMKVLAEAVTTIRTDRARREDDAQRIADEAEELIAQVAGDIDTDEVEAEEAVTAEAEQIVEDAANAEAEAEVEAAPEVEAQPEAVTASAPAPRQARRPRREPVVTASKGFTMTAKAGIPGTPAGTEFESVDEIGAAMLERGKHLSDMSGREPIVRFETQPDIMLKEGATRQQVEDAINQVANQDALVAAGEWCSPSTPLYDYFGVEGTDGLLNLPSIGVERGGIQVPTPLLMPADLSTVTFVYTETNRENNDTKACVEVSCPTWNDVRLEADGLCVTAGNLTKQTNPELISRYIQLVLAAHVHKMNAKRITSIMAGSTDATAQPAPGSGASDILNGVALLAAYYRDLYKTPVNAILEVVLPKWAQEAVRADLANRKGVALLAVTDAEIDAFFTARKLRPQFIGDWQVLSGATAWPTSVEYVVYQAGAWVLGDAGTLDLGVTRDSTLNATNDYTAAWTEDFTLLANRGPSLKGDITSLALDGITAPEPVV